VSLDSKSFASVRSGQPREAAIAKHEQAYERLGAKVLTLPDVIAQSVGFMGPVFSSAFVIPLVVGVISASGKGGGVASPLSVLIAAVGVFAIGAIVCRYAREVHAAGSLYDYVTRGLGERTGTAVFLIGASLVTLAVDQWWTGLFALPDTPHYFSLFAWGSTFGGFALVVVYLLMAVGSLRSYGSAPGRVWLVVSAVIAIAITAGAIYASFYKVTSPTIYAPWIALAVLVIGFASTFVTRARRSASSELSDLTKSTA